MRAPSFKSTLAALAALFLAGAAPRAPAQCQVAKLTAADGAATDRFGFSVGLGGETAIIGAPWHDARGENFGSAYLFDAAQGAWAQVGKLPPPGSSVGIGLGRSVSAHASRVIFGVMPDQAAYVFERLNKSWRRTGQMQAGWLGDFFGWSLALDGDVAVVGAPQDDENGFRSGAAYVFERQPGGEWVQTAKLLASDGRGGDKFATAVAVSGDVIVGGARDAAPLGNWSGAAYIFERNAGTWAQAAKLVASDGSVLHAFGESVAVSNGTVLIGATNADARETHAGAAYLFERNGAAVWVEIAKLIADDGNTSDSFGRAVALDDDMAVIGASNDHDREWLAGAAYVFEADATGSWAQVAKIIAADRQPEDHFGRAVALSGDYAVIGAPFDDDLGTDSGSAYVFSLNSDFCECLAADLDGDGVVGLGDLGILLGYFGCAPPATCVGDIDNDGDTDLADLGILLARFGEVCQ